MVHESTAKCFSIKRSFVCCLFVKDGGSQLEKVKVFLRDLFPELKRYNNSTFIDISREKKT